MIACEDESIVARELEHLIASLFSFSSLTLLFSGHVEKAPLLPSISTALPFEGRCRSTSTAMSDPGNLARLALDTVNPEPPTFSSTNASSSPSSATLRPCTCRSSSTRGTLMTGSST